MKTQFNPFVIEYDELTGPALDFKIECILASNKSILQNLDNKPVVVMMSGGIDSELIAQSMLLAGIPFKCVIGRLCTVLADDKSVIFNDHDYCYAERWCKKFGIEVLYCDIDIFKHNRLLSEYVLSAQGFSPQYACHMYVMKWCDDNNLFFLAGNGEMDFVLRDDRYFMMDEQREFTLDNFCKLHNLSGVWQFWKQDARVSSAFLQLPTVKKLMESKCKSLLDYKHDCFRDAFDFEPRVKQTGFEKIQEWDSITRNQLKVIVGEYDHKYYTPIEHFLYESSK